MNITKVSKVKLPDKFKLRGGGGGGQNFKTQIMSGPLFFKTIISSSSSPFKICFLGMH